MPKISWILLPLALSLSSVAGAPANLEVDPVIATASQRVVALEVDRESEGAVPRPVSPGRTPPEQSDPEREDYYRRPPGPASGLLLDASGNILTTHYNVRGTVRGITVILPGGARHPARIVAHDRVDDLALVRLADPVPSLEAPPLRWLEPGQLLAGKMVLAIGRSPDPARPTVTLGVVSAPGRNGGRAFQTDAKLNYGNVGGPLIDLDGRVAGLACFVGHTYRFWGLNSGIGFGTSSSTIQQVLPLLLAGKDVPPPERPFLGVGPGESPGVEGDGAHLGNVVAGSAAAQGGLRVGDLVLSLDGQKVEDFTDLRRAIGRHQPGDEAVVKIRRGGEELELKVKVGKAAE